MVPHYAIDILPLLEEIAIAASEHVGVILLSADPETSGKFVARQRYPERFSVVAGEFDTPWIRDRSPIAVAEGGLISWIIPKMPDMGDGGTTLCSRRYPPDPGATPPS